MLRFLRSIAATAGNVILTTAAILFPLWLFIAITRVFFHGPSSLIQPISYYPGEAIIELGLFWGMFFLGILGIIKFIKLNRQSKEIKETTDTRPIWYTKKIALWHFGLCLVSGSVVFLLEHLCYLPAQTFYHDTSRLSKVFINLLGLFNLSINVFGLIVSTLFFPSKPESFFIKEKMLFYAVYTIIIPINVLIYWGLIRLWITLYRKIADPY